MPFEITSLWLVKSVSQRALAAYWGRLAAGRRFPAFTEFLLESGLHDPKQLVVWNIEGEGRQQKLRALYQGENVAEVFNSAWAGRTMDDVVPMPLRRVTLDAAKECAASGCLIYTIVSTFDANDRRVECERLLLPFGRDDSKVEQILASLQLVSAQGGVLRRNILNHFQMQADLIFSGKIKSEFAGTNPSPSIPTIDDHEITSGTVLKQEEPRHDSKLAPALRNPADATVGEIRRAPRRKVLKAAKINFGKESMTCTVRNLSATGAAIQGAGMELAARPCKVVWRKGTQIGVRFG